MTTDHSTPQPGTGPSVTSSSGPTDAQLNTDLRSELSILEHDPGYATSGWAAALGVPEGLPTLGGGGAAGGYRFSPSALDTVIAQWRSIVERAQRFDDSIGVITMVTSPASDDASTSFTSQAKLLGNNLATSHDTFKEYASNYAAKLVAVQQNYTATEQHVAASLNTSGGGGS